MEKVLEQILEKLNSMETEQKEQGKKLSGLDSKVTNLETEQKERFDRIEKS
jgi:hypothetical protein